MANKKEIDTPSEKNSEMAGVMDRNIKELIKLRQNEEKEKSLDERIADKITGFTGTMFFVYIHCILFGLYILWNAGLTGFKSIHNFSGLSTIASVEAIFLSTFVLIRQNRMNKLADKRANLDLHVSLLAEHEITRLLNLVTEIARKLKIADADNPNFDDLANDLSPEAVLETIDKHKEDSMKETGIKF